GEGGIFRTCNLSLRVATDPTKIQEIRDWPIPTDAMMTLLVLALLNFSKEFMVETDACRIEIGVVLIQEGHPIAYLSRALSEKHQALSTYEKEFLAVILALEKRKGYLLDKHFKIRTDHFSYDYEIDYKKGIGNTAVDALLRVDNQVELASLIATTITSVLLDKIKESWNSDPGLKSVIEKLQVDANKENDEPLLIHNKVWSDISIDFVEGLPSSHGKTAVFVVVDRFSKYAHFISLKHHFYASQVTQAFMKNVYKLHGLPEIIISDRDKVFFSQFWQALFKMLKIKLQMSIAYHP
ncbi:putative mitochondrial protein, partial [Tanacetum coccineum]